MVILFSPYAVEFRADSYRRLGTTSFLQASSARPRTQLDPRMTQL